ncbi:MAG: acyl-CoA dehydrogenase family protein [candidate division KSB1 bacterium]|nr:acyl-CoA dehydrogenase family protein [candidate division KSB1 bacterium]MDZ7302668.1 acyl-CoA dehydrogenase family protein [candidate division KSB1 bacterium]MDZ7311802.1 acyl-CoA dehydrogenase family protein [candidate division KSB1 bacterium]
MKNTGLDKETLDLTLAAIKEFAASHLPEEKLLELDAKDEFPVDLVREMCTGLGIQLLFIPEEFGGMGGGAFDVYRICEQMARIDLGIATGVLATFLGSDPIMFGGTPEQKKKWLTRIAEEGLLMAYGATEPEAGSDLAALRTTATPVEQDGKIVGYKISGNKMWISNGGYADLYSILAKAPGGPSWFVVEKGVPGFSHGKPEDKHGIRASNTAALSLDDVYVEADRLLGVVEGQGLIQAQLVFGYTRLMVAAFGLGAGWAALDRAIPYSTERIQAGGPLSEKQGYTHKLIVPHVARLEASRAYIEESAERIDSTGNNLNTEGAIAKYLATEAGNLAADASIQALGGYGYVKEYLVEKIKRDVRITTIYEGTSEIMEMTICRDRWQLHLKTRGQHYHDEAQRFEELHGRHPKVGANIAALSLHALAELLERARLRRLTRNQHVMFRLGELIAYAECAGSLANRAARAAEGKLNPKADTRFNPEALAALSRVFAREAAMKVAEEGMRWIIGADDINDVELAEFAKKLNLPAMHRTQAGLIADMDFMADVIYGRK